MAAKSKAAKYTRERLAASEKFGRYRDLLDVLLSDDTEYTIEETQKLIDEFLKRKVK